MIRAAGGEQQRRREPERHERALRDAGRAVRRNMTVVIVLSSAVNLLVLAIFFENWAAFDEPETPMMEMLQEELGEDETQQLMQQFGNSFSAVESMVLRWRRDLSVPPPAMRDDGPGGGSGGGGGTGSGGG